MIGIGDKVVVVGLGWGVTSNMDGIIWEVIGLGPKRSKLRAVSHYWHRDVRVRYEQLRKVS